MSEIGRGEGMIADRLDLQRVEHAVARILADEELPLEAYSAVTVGVRCADSTRLSCAIPNSVRTSLACRMASQSDLLPIKMPTSG